MVRETIDRAAAWYLAEHHDAPVSLGSEERVAWVGERLRMVTTYADRPNVWVEVPMTVKASKDWRAIERTLGALRLQCVSRQQQGS